MVKNLLKRIQTKIVYVTTDKKTNIKDNTFESLKVISNDRNVSTASSLESSRNIAATGDIAWNVDFKGHEDVTAAATLATVNTSAGLPGPFGSSTVIPVINVNEKGLVTAVSTQNITTVPNALTANKLTTPRTCKLGEGGDADIISIGNKILGMGKKYEISCKDVKEFKVLDKNSKPSKETGILKTGLEHLQDLLN